ncbi:hypothetical protein LTR53_006653 [Teratosphaeriaceae sp. CCFEE 6253]|nr:hypothetical protein LTR53_006653 [Teratosphaeriaceae sp. CCFEE 6253]
MAAHGDVHCLRLRSSTNGVGNGSTKYSRTSILLFSRWQQNGQTNVGLYYDVRAGGCTKVDDAYVAEPNA